MKRKLLLGALAALSAIGLTVGLTACGKTDDGSIHPAYEYDKEREAYAVTGLMNLPSNEAVKENPDLLPKTLTIPATYEDAPVYIGEGAFEGYDYLESVTLEAGVLSIEGNAFSGCTALKEIALSEGLLSIGKGAFQDCTALTKVAFPASLQEVDTAAFLGCESLKELTVEGSSAVYSAQDNILFDKGMTEIVFAPAAIEGEISLPSTLTSVGANIFYDHDSITAVTVPASVKAVGANAFASCDALEQITLEAGLESIGEGAFAKDTVLSEIGLPATLKTVGANAFASCTSLESVTFSGNALKSVPDGLFAECAKLVSIELPAGVTSIGNNAFSGCVSLSSVSIPAGVDRIGERAFYGCSAIERFDVADENEAYHAADGCLIDAKTNTLLYGCNKENIDLGSIEVAAVAPYAFRFMGGVESVAFPATLSDVGKDAFFGCSGLKSLTVAETCEKYLSASGVLYEKGSDITFFLIPAVLEGEIDIPEGVKGIPENSFEHRGIASVSIPTSVTSIGKNAFSGCASLAAVSFKTATEETKDGENVTETTVYSKLTSIGERAFANCVLLTSFEVPGSTSAARTATIGNQAFYGCQGLQTVDLGDRVATVSATAFDGCVGLKEIAVNENNKSYLGKDGVLYSLSNGRVTGFVHVPAALEGDIEIPEGLTSIGEGAFAGRNISSVTIPTSVTSIGNNAFSGCASLSAVTFKTATEETKDKDGNTTTTTVYSKLTSIGDYAFANTNLSGIQLPAALTTIGSYAFAETGLTQIALPEKLTSIGNYAFSKTQLAEIVIPAYVTGIGTGAFSGCASLASVTFATAQETTTDAQGNSKTETVYSKLATLGSYAFKDCTALHTIALPKALTSLGSFAFQGCTMTGASYAGTAEDWQKVTVGSGNESFAELLTFATA